jgi:phenylacetate-CoA ligase
MRLSELAARHLLLPLHERLRGRDTLAQWRAFRAQDHQSPASLDAVRLAKLRRLIAHCQQHVPYYQQVFAEGSALNPAEFQFTDLARLPILERAALRERGDELKAQGWDDRLIRYSTGGSTGEPLVFYTDKHRESCLNAQKLRGRAWFGVLPGDRQIDFWGSPIELSRQSRLRRLKDRWLLNQVVLSASNLSLERIDGYLAYLDHFQPRLIYGYPTVIYRIASRILETGKARRPWSPKLIACTSEMLWPHMRAVIAQAFECPIANEYGSRDGGMIAHECPEGHLHLFAEHVVVEVDQPDAEGVGDLLVTNLDGFGMPFIRYRIGDRGALTEAPCPCGLPLPRLRQLQGRANDFLIGRDGRMIHSSTANYVLREIPALRQYQLRQRADRHFDLYMVLHRPLTDDERTRIRSGLQQVIDEPLEVNLIEQEHIAPEPSGKYRWVISEARS